MIIHNAVIHSPVERFATALQIEDGIISWMGDEDTCAFRIRAFPDVEVIDAHGELITPAFHDAVAPLRDPREFHRHGITAAHVRAQAPEDLLPLHESLDVTGVFTWRPPAGPGVHLLTSGASTAEMDDFLRAERPAVLVPAIEVRSEDDVAAFSALAHPGPAGGVLHLDAGLHIDVEKLEGWSVVVDVQDRIDARLGDLARNGIPYALRGERGPWSTITDALFTGPAPISGRAAFTAYTRGAWRIAAGQPTSRGVLQVGAPADLAFWATAALAVQAPNEATAQWSTDQRAGTPLLPALGPGEELPVLRRLLRRGTPLYPTA